ncbi:MFS transporter, SIT family, siderophore-iron:H+ symporter [Purpureocillium lavendulum]|uniref:MFS transporter, SIT family, siderophore-iron:H+ symporter n=1 Tax=Purpureocillium lavendulum TaxID=1247861 RepID=A0AB34FAR4_9HYPO|nr:MFS transporter, SIT family, siderophore-iron:H+ symporter [Purpureocillium lavendulum]
MGGISAGKPLPHRAGWRWSFGTFAIAAPILGLPIILLLYHEYNVINVRYAEGKHETAWDGIKYYWWSLTVRLPLPFALLMVIKLSQLGIGVLLLAVAFSLLLLPFSLYARQDKGWASPAIICMLVFSGVAFSLFAIWEKFFASKCFLPVGLMRDRTIIGASIASANTYLVYYVWSSYFSSHLQVVQGLSVTTAGYVASIHSLGWVVAGIVAGALVSATGQYKWIALYVGWPLQTLAMGLIVHLSQADSRLGLIVMAQIFLAVADGLIYLASEIAVLAVIEPEHIAVVLAAYNMTTAVFQGIGSTISGAVWTNDFPANLARHLPNDVQPQLMAIYSSLRTQLSFPEGSLARVAIVESYLGASRKLFIISTSLTVIGLMTTLVWRNLAGYYDNSGVILHRWTIGPTVTLRELDRILDRLAALSPFSSDDLRNDSEEQCNLTSSAELLSGLGDSADFIIVGGHHNTDDEHDIGMGKLWWTAFYIGCVDNKDEVCRFDTKPRIRIIDIVDKYGISKDHVVLLNRQGYFTRMPFAMSTPKFDVVLESAQRLRPVELFTHPYIVELVGAGFDKPANTAYYTLRFPRVLKIHDDRSFGDTISFKELQEMAQNCLAMPDKAQREEKQWRERLCGRQQIDEE